MSKRTLESPTKSHQQARTTRPKQSLRLWLRLLACESIIEQTVRARLRKNFAVTLPQFDILSELERADEPLTMSQLSQELMVSNGNVTGVIDRLERDSYVRREASATDRRVQYIALTDRGLAAFKEMAQAHEQWITELFADMSTSEIKNLLAVLGQAKKSIVANS